MGRAKEQQMEEEEQGWDFSDQWVCSNCVDDSALKAAIDASATIDEACSFCDSVPSAPMDDLMRAFVGGLLNEYEDALEHGYWDGREGGYQAVGAQWNSYDLVWDHSDVLVGKGLIEAVQRLLHDKTWVQREFWRRPDDTVLTESWSSFKESVKYKTRYVFWLADQTESESEMYSPGEVKPALILEEISTLLERLKLLRPLLRGSEFWRAQVHVVPRIEPTAVRLGTAPRQFATQANRMNPAGIPMFYGAESAETAIRETAAGHANMWVTCGLFRTSRECLVADFTQLPAIPSMFDPEWGALRRALIFLHQFTDELSAPVTDGRESIDYVPTQVVTEYLLRVYERGAAVSGLLYRSSITGEICTALDVPNERCVDMGADREPSPDLELEFVIGSVFRRYLGWRPPIVRLILEILTKLRGFPRMRGTR